MKWCLLIPTWFFLAPFTSAQTTPFDDGDLEALSQGLAEYLEAREAGEGVEATRAELISRIEALSGGSAGAESAHRDQALGRALWLSRDYGRERLRPGKVTEEASKPGSFAGGSLEYAFRVPRDYDPTASGYPLIVAIPDGDESPAEHIRTYWSSSVVRDGAIVISPRMPEERDEWDRVMVNGRPGGLCNVLTALRLAQERFAVDFERVYVTGRGKGVPAAIAAGNYGPHRFAGVVTRSGDASEQGPENFGNLPTLMCAAGTHARAFQASAQAAGIDNCEIESTKSEEDIWAWMQEHPRESTPAQATVVVGKPFPTRVNWLRIAPNSPTARATGRIDSDLNSITLEASGASYATLYLNDRLIDLQREVTLRCNGRKEVLTLDRDLTTTLNLIHDGTSDPGCIYSLQVIVDLRPEAPTLVAGDGASSDPEFEGYLADAVGNTGKLWELYLWCRRTARDGRGLAVLNQLLSLDGEHTEATAAMDLLTRGPLEPSAAERRRFDQGWIRQDLNWIAPDDRPRVERGEWFVDGEWMNLGSANRRHASISDMWEIPGPGLVLHSTADRQTSLLAKEQMQLALGDLRRVFGTAPEETLHVALLRDEEQYDRFAFGDPDGRRPASHVGRLHVVHSGFFAESWLPNRDGKRQFSGMGVGYWDPLVPGGNAYGRHSARLAAGLSFVDAIDPSTKTVRKARSRGVSPDYYDDYQAEKRLPAWLRFGAAVYGERFFRDESVPSDGDAYWARTWSLESLASRGGMRPVSEVMAFEIQPEDREDGLKLYIEAGLLVAFLVDGACGPVTETHETFKRVFAEGHLKPSHVRDMEEALVEHESELRAFARP